MEGMEHVSGSAMISSVSEEVVSSADGSRMSDKLALEA